MNILDVSQEIRAFLAAHTSMLTLNASIEAARAGERGQGFAVITGEIQPVNRTTAAAKREIMQAVVEAGGTDTSVSGTVEEQAAAIRNVMADAEGITFTAKETGRNSIGILEISVVPTTQATE